MKRTVLVAGLGVCSLVAVSTGWAQREREPGERQAEPRGQAQRGPREERRADSGLPRELAATADELNLTEEQRSAAADAVRDMRAALAEWDAQNHETVSRLQTEMRAAAEASDRGDARRGNEQLRPLMADRRRIEQEGQQRAMAVLTAEQRLELGGILALRDHEFQSMLKALELPPDQEAALKEKVKAAGIAAAKWEMENGDAFRKLEMQIQDLHAEIQPLREARQRLAAEGKAAVLAGLTPEQRTALSVARLYDQATAVGRAVQLSDAQLAAIRTLCEQLVQDAGPAIQADARAVGQLREKLLTTIRDEILTDDQRAQVRGGRR